MQKEHEELQHRLEAEAQQAALLKKEHEKLQQSSVHSQETLMAQVQLEILKNQDLQAEPEQARLELCQLSEEKLEKSIQRSRFFVRTSGSIILKDRGGSDRLSYRYRLVSVTVEDEGGNQTLAGFRHVREVGVYRHLVSVSYKAKHLCRHCQMSVIPKIPPKMECCPPPSPLFTFGVIADIQYADIDDGYNFSLTSKRYYRGSLQLLRNAQKSWSTAAIKPDFILQLGDIIDGFNKRDDSSEQALDSVLKEFSSSPVEVHHVWGNHEFYNFSRSVLLRSKLNSSPQTDRCLSGDIYAYHFSPFPGFKFVVLDAYDISLLGREETSQQYTEAMNLIKQFNRNHDLNCPPALAGGRLQQRFAKFNGGFSKEQLDWLDSVLSSADEKQERVTLVSKSTLIHLMSP
ncbi:uncharacterized protein V6R79_024537 [Siganus canaliculatus]